MNKAVIARQLEALARQIVAVGGLQLRDVVNGEAPFVYTSGLKGPGFVDIGGLVACSRLNEALATTLAVILADQLPETRLLAANATRGIAPGVLLQQQLSRALGVDIQLVYVRNEAKGHGLGDRVTGLSHVMGRGEAVVIVDELVNEATTTVQTASLLRNLGFEDVREAACFVSYNTPTARTRLGNHGITLHSLLTVEDLLTAAIASGKYKAPLVESYRDYMANPSAWMTQHGLEPDHRPSRLTMPETTPSSFLRHK